MDEYGRTGEDEILKPWSDSQVAAEIEECERLEDLARTQAALEAERDRIDRDAS